MIMLMAAKGPLCRAELHSRVVRWGLKPSPHVTCPSVPWCALPQTREGFLAKPCTPEPTSTRWVPLTKFCKGPALVQVFLEADLERDTGA